MFFEYLSNTCTHFHNKERKIFIHIKQYLLMSDIYTVSHFSYAPLFKSPHFFTKLLESNILYDNYLLTFNLFDDIKKKYRNHSCESFCYAKGNCDKSTRLHVQTERLYFLFAFCARHYPVIVVTEKRQKQLFYSSKPPFLVVEISNTVTV